MFRVLLRIYSNFIYYFKGRNEPIQNIMIFNQTKCYITLLAFVLLTIIPSMAQEEIVHGKVTAYNEIAVKNATISIKKSKKHVLTNSLGFFSIDCKIKDKITISAIGFDKKTMKVNSIKDSILVDLKISKESDIDLAAAEGHINENEVNLVIKYFNTKPDYGFGYTSTIELILDKNPEIKYINYEFIIRGINSFNGPNGALIALNGIISDMGSISGLPAIEVKSTEVLTGGAASRYGPGSSNGVVSVRTRSK